MGLVTDMTDLIQTILRDIPKLSEIEKNIDKLPLNSLSNKDLINERKASSKSVFTQRCKLFASRQDKLNDNMNKLYAVIWGQSSLVL